MNANKWKRIGVIASVVWILCAGLLTYEIQAHDNVSSANSLWEACRKTLTEQPSRAAECDMRRADLLRETLPYPKYVALAVAIIPVPLCWGFAYLTVLAARFGRRAWMAWSWGPVVKLWCCGLILASALVSATAYLRHPDHPATSIWVGNADIEDPNSRDAVSAFQNAFVREPACRGLTLSLTKMPSKPFWFIETYSSNTNEEVAEGAPYKLSWWMDLDADPVITSRVESDPNRSFPGQAVQDVCSIVDQTGGIVR